MSPRGWPGSARGSRRAAPHGHHHGSGPDSRSAASRQHAGRRRARQRHVPADLPLELAGVLASRLHRLTKSWWEQPSPTMATPGDLRSDSASLRPGPVRRPLPPSPSLALLAGLDQAAPLNGCRPADQSSPRSSCGVEITRRERGGTSSQSRRVLRSDRRTGPRRPHREPPRTALAAIHPAASGLTTRRERRCRLRRLRRCPCRAGNCANRRGRGRRDPGAVSRSLNATRW